MFCLPGVIALVTLIYVRPQEFIPELERIPLLYLFLGAALFGLFIDLKLRLVKPRMTPQTIWILIFIVWCIVTLLVKAPQTLFDSMIQLAIIFVVFYVIAHGVQSFKAFHVMAVSVLVLVWFLALVGVHQGLAPKQCLVLTETLASGAPAAGRPDGRPCKRRQDCAVNPEPGAEYICEGVGLFGTTTISGRVRYRGTLGDPNELSMALSAGIPIPIALMLLYRTRLRVAVVGITVLLVLVTVLMSSSRGGLLVFSLVLGIWAFKRYGKKAVVIALILMLPAFVALKLQKRVDASASSEERMEIIYEGVNMYRSSPVFGVGFNQFIEHHNFTAHNSYLLALSELGLPGAFFWYALVYVSMKIIVLGIRRYRDDPEGQIAHIWGWALLASMSGMLFGIFFLSFCYHIVLWVFFGLVGAYYSAVKSHDPEFKVSFSLVDFSALSVITLTFAVGLFVFARIHTP